MLWNPELNEYKVIVLDWIVTLQNSYVEALSPNVTIFEDVAFKKVIKIEWGYKFWALIQYGLCPYNNWDTEQVAHAPRKGQMRREQDGSHLHVKGEGPQEKLNLPTPWSDFQPPGLWEN